MMKQGDVMKQERQTCKRLKGLYCEYYECKCTDIKYCQIVKDEKAGC